MKKLLLLMVLLLIGSVSASEIRFDFPVQDKESGFGHTPILVGSEEIHIGSMQYTGIDKESRVFIEGNEQDFTNQLRFRSRSYTVSPGDTITVDNLQITYHATGKKDNDDLLILTGADYNDYVVITFDGNDFAVVYTEFKEVGSDVVTTFTINNQLFDGLLSGIDLKEKTLLLYQETIVSLVAEIDRGRNDFEFTISSEFVGQKELTAVRVLIFADGQEFSFSDDITVLINKDRYLTVTHQRVDC